MTATEARPEEATKATQPVLTFDDVLLEFSGVTALNGVSFTVDPGELFAIIGPNGAGKTSIFNVLSGVYRPQRGSVSPAPSRTSSCSPTSPCWTT